VLENPDVRDIQEKYELKRNQIRKQLASFHCNKYNQEAGSNERTSGSRDKDGA
jgi:hypothetical protein